MKLLGIFLSIAITSARADFTLIAEGKPNAVIVTPDRPTRVASYAAQELAWHIEQASGKRLPIVPEQSALAQGPCIFVGPCRAAGVEKTTFGSDQWTPISQNSTVPWI